MSRRGPLSPSTIHFKQGVLYDKNVSTSTFISVLQFFNDLTWAIKVEDFVASMNGVPNV